jgi:hypothetical protein
MSQPILVENIGPGLRGVVKGPKNVGKREVKGTLTG